MSASLRSAGSKDAVAVPVRSERAWIFQLNAQEHSTFLATFGGWALDGMDFMVYTFVISSLIDAWKLSDFKAGVLGTVPLLVSSVGGWLAGLLADRLGRARVLRYTILWFAVTAFLSGFTHSFWQLLVTRGLQGLGLGGEWAVGSVLIAEIIRGQHRGKAVGTVQAGWAVGWGLAAIFSMIMPHLPVKEPWRAMFWIGILPALLVIYIRRHVAEPEVFKNTRRVAAAIGESHFLEIFSPDQLPRVGSILRVTALTSLLAVGVQGGYYALMIWLPRFLKITYGLSVLGVGRYLLVIITGSFVGYIVSGYLADRLGRKKTLILFGVCAFLSVIPYMYMRAGNGVILLLGFPLGFFASGSFSPIGSFFTELFPSRVRASGQGFSYNFGRAIGALFPALTGLLTKKMTLGHSIAIFAMAAYLVFILATVLLPETRGTELQVCE